MSTLSLVLSIIGGGGLLGLVTTLVKISMDYQKLKSSKENMEKMLDSQKTKTNALLNDFTLIHSDFMQLKMRVDENERRDTEERKSNSNKFNELYNSRNQTNESLIKLTSTVENLVTLMSNNFDAINKKFEEIKQDIKGNRNDSKR